ncbi:MAG: recombinase family protein, partial [Desulfobacterales bacterium]|nr:recombinase family protein [Desulfobacterales bacterium]
MTPARFDVATKLRATTRMVKKTTVNASGVKADRPALNEILEFIRKGDCLVVWRLDRLGRSLKHLIEVVEDLENRKVGFVSLQEGINTTTAGGRLVFHLFGALSEFEHNLIRERTCAGATAAGIVLLAKDPSAVFPQCRILADAYRGAEPDGAPRDHEDIRGAMPQAIERAIAFIDRNTRHPMRIVGLNRVRLDEYPVDGLREALVNAAAHRLYEDAGRKILLEVFSDRIVLSSPGLPPKPLTLASLRKGKYRPCSRNPVLAQCLSYFHRIEERGSGFRRMHDQMLNHGLDQPLLSTEMGYFQVTFPGPGENIERLRA